MSRINTTRIGGIIKYIAQNPATKSQATPHAAPTTNTTKKERSLEVLRTRPRHRIAALDQTQERFIETAATIVTQEILIWEFGSNILEHSEFNQITQEICQTMMGHPELAEAMGSLVRRDA